MKNVINVMSVFIFILSVTVFASVVSAEENHDKKESTSQGTEYCFEVYDVNNNCSCCWNGVEGEFCNCPASTN